LFDYSTFFDESFSSHGADQRTQGYVMKTKLIGMALAGALTLPTVAAHAATIAMDPSGGDLTYTIHNSGLTSPSPTIAFDNIHGPANDFEVLYTAGAGTNLTQANGNTGGFAWVGGNETALTITPLSGFVGFTAFKFNLEFDNSTYKKPYQIKFDLTYANGSSETFNLGEVFDNDTDWGQPAKFSINVEDEGYITAIKVYDFGAKNLAPPNQPLGNIKQASFEAAIAPAPAPEPATWAMMIVGFGGVGAVVRQRRRLLA